MICIDCARHSLEWSTPLFSLRVPLLDYITVKPERWLQNKGIDEIEEAPMLEEDNKYTVFQNKSVIERKDEWISYDGQMITIER